MGIPVQGDQRIAIAGTLQNITVNDLAAYVIAKIQAAPAPSADLSAVQSAEASLQAAVNALAGHGPQPDAEK